MLKYFLPAQEDFFELFRKIADELLEVSKQFEVLFANLNTPERFVAAIQTHEERAHAIINLTLEKLHKTFISPFDRYDIHRFVKKLDETVDAVQRTAQRIEIYKLKTLPDEIHSMANLCLESAKIIHTTTAQLHSLKNASKILELCDQVSQYEIQAEQLLLSGVSKLFEEESDLRQLLKIKEIYDYCKASLNGFQTVSNITKDIVLEYS